MNRALGYDMGPEEEPIEIPLTLDQFADAAEAQAKVGLEVFRELNRSGRLAEMGISLEEMEKLFERDIEVAEQLRKGHERGND